MRLAMSKKKRDTGIARLKNGLLIPEAQRDALNKRDWTHKPAQSFNPDNATTKELETANFSGFRVNAFTGNVECWVIGEIRGTRKLQHIQQDPKQLAELHEEVFATAGSVIETDYEDILRRMKPNAPRH